MLVRVTALPPFERVEVKLTWGADMGSVGGRTEKMSRAVTPMLEWSSKSKLPGKLRGASLSAGLMRPVVITGALTAPAV